VLTLFSRDALQRDGDGCKVRCEARGGCTFKHRNTADTPSCGNPVAPVVRRTQLWRPVLLRRRYDRLLAELLARATASFAPNRAWKIRPPLSRKQC